MSVRKSTCLEFAAHTKIADFDMPVISDQQIFWFDVSMDNVLCAATQFHSINFFENQVTNCENHVAQSHHSYPKIPEAEGTTTIYRLRRHHF